MLIRRETIQDVPLIDEVHRRAFKPETPPGEVPVEVGLVHLLRADPGWVPALSLVCEGADGSVVGHVVGTEGRLGATRVIGLGPLGVLPGEQRRGVGAALMHAVVAATDALEYHAVVLLGSTDYYPRFGFVPASSIGISSPDPSWGDNFQARCLGTHSGDLSGTFEYAAPFNEV